MAGHGAQTSEATCFYAPHDGVQIRVEHCSGKRGVTITRQQADRDNRSIEELVVAFQTGPDREATFQELFLRLRKPVAIFFARRGCSDAECQDLTQDVFAQVWRHLDSFRGDALFTTWLRRTVENRWRNHCRYHTQSKRSGEEVPIDDYPDGIAPAPTVGSEPPNDPLAKVLINEEYDLLWQAINELPLQHRRLVLMRVGQNLKYREIADLLSMPVGTVKSQLAKARQKLHLRLNPHYADITL